MGLSEYLQSHSRLVLADHRAIAQTLLYKANGQGAGVSIQSFPRLGRSYMESDSRDGEWWIHELEITVADDETGIETPSDDDVVVWQGNNWHMGSVAGASTVAGLRRLLYQRRELVRKQMRGTTLHE